VSIYREIKVVITSSEAKYLAQFNLLNKDKARNNGWLTQNETILYISFKRPLFTTSSKRNTLPSLQHTATPFKAEDGRTGEGSISTPT